jgi:hypothetical protein
VQKNSKNKLNFDQPALHGGATPPLTWSKKKHETRHIVASDATPVLTPKDAEPH